MFRRVILFALVAIAPLTASASGAYLDYFFRSPKIADAGLAAQFQQIVAGIDDRQYLAADQAMDKLLAAPATADMAPAAHAKLLTDAGILKAVTDQDAQSLLLLTQSVKMLDESVAHDSLLQFNPYMVSGLVKAKAGDYPAAVEFYRRAQHILHLQDGVYTRKQIPVLDELTKVDAARGTLLLSDIEQRFALRIAERAYGANSEAVIPTLEKVARYFAIRGRGLPRFVVDYDIASTYLRGKVPPEMLQGGRGTPYSMRSGAGAVLTDTNDNLRSVDSFGNGQIRFYRDSLFDESIKLYQRAITILEKKYGNNDLRLVQPLKALANTRLVEGGHRRDAKSALERATSIIETNPATDLEDQVLAIVHLADFYTITDDRRARETYHKAWQMLNQHAGTKKLESQLFAKPVRLYPEPANFVLKRRPQDVSNDEPLFLTLGFTVDESGVPRQVHAIKGNIPAQNQNYIVMLFGDTTRYRPALVGGYPVATPNVTYTQSYVAPEHNVSKNEDTTKPQTKSAKSNPAANDSGTGA